MNKNIITTLILLSFISKGFSHSIKTNDIVGLWRIESFTIINTKGVARKWAEQIHGTLFYSKDNFMSVSLNGKNGKSNKILFYSGTYDVYSDKEIVHSVLNASDPNRINKIMFRKAEINSGYLTLIAKAKYGTAILKWKKIKVANLIKSQNRVD
ncbi:MAG: hypothetical protein JJT82_05900 [Legionellaceae bacterium]|nr:hypothetical protein [Legionellaceae bacterium]